LAWSECLQMRGKNVLECDINTDLSDARNEASCFLNGGNTTMLIKTQMGSSKTLSGLPAGITVKPRQEKRQCERVTVAALIVILERR